MQLFLPAVCLRKMDRTSMASSLEVRVPLLDLAVARVATRIDAQVRNPNYEMKALIKQLARDKLPAAVVNKKKKGFSTPVRHWFSPDNIIKEIQADMAQGTWWKSVFSANADQAVRQLRGRALWRFWHTWRWLKNHGGDEVTATPP
jgi:asparagine synthetase B (glutamine-hydrolysing)